MRQNRLQRLREIGSILIKYGFEDLLAHLKLSKKIRSRKDENVLKTIPSSRWKRIRLVFEELGTTYIKLGQMMSNRSDIFPKELIFELEKLQDEVPPFDPDEALRILEEDLKRPYTEVFDFFDLNPMASASISQVHKGILKDNQKEVAVKIRRPNLKDQIDVDLQILKDSANFLQKYITEVKQFSVYDFLLEFEAALNKELNFKAEANNILKFKKRLEKHPYVHIPEVYEKYCSKRVIVMEFITGVKINNVEKLKQPPYNPELIATRYLELYFDQIFNYGIFHADPHPGNIYVYPDNTFAFIDFGIVGLVHKRDKDLLTSIIIGIEEKNAKKILHAFQKVTPNPIDNQIALEYRLTELIEDLSYQEIADIDVHETGNRIRSLVLDFNIQIPSNFFLLSKAISIVEGTVKELNPNLQIEKAITPHARKLILKRLNPFTISKNILLSSVDFASIIQEIPNDLEEIIKKIKEGTININLEHRGLDNLIQSFNKEVNRLVLAFLQASLLVASAIIILAKIPPRWNEISIIGMVGFVISGVLALILIYRIIRDRKW
ncbi:MAG: ABC1 kinase family protein [Candidatus Cyclobacteriaceae bacterium M2_1C_046]